jgi:hypothetical protein
VLGNRGHPGCFLLFILTATDLAHRFLVSVNGSKWWVIIGPRDRRNVSDFASMEKVYQFHAGDGIDATALGDVQVEAVLLRPGTRLCVLSLSYSEMCSSICRYMKPNTAHAILTPDAAICYGGHYITTSNLWSTCYGHLTGFSMSTLLTNTNHTSECQLLFWNMLSYYFDVYTRGGSDDAGTSKVFTTNMLLVHHYSQGHLNLPLHMCLTYRNSMAYTICSFFVILSRWPTSSIQRHTVKVYVRLSK